MARLRTPNFVLRRLVFVKLEIQIYQHTGNRLMECYSLAIWLPESTFADSSVTHSFWGRNRGGRMVMRTAGMDLVEPS